MKKITLSLFLALGTLIAGNSMAQCVANGTLTSTSTPGEFTITDLSTVSSTGYSYFSASDGGYLGLQPSTTSGTYQFPADGVYTYYFAVMDSSSVFCWDTLAGTIVVSGMSSTPTCQASFNMYHDSTNVGIYWAWNTSQGSSPSAPLSYSWDFGDGTTSNLAYPSHTYSSIGVYAVCLTIAELGTTCTDTYCDTIVVSVKKSSGTTLNILPPGASAGVEEIAGFSSLTAYPNPSNGLFTVEVSAKAEGNTQISILNLAGQVVATKMDQLEVGNNKIEMNASNLSEGIYLVQVLDVTSGMNQTIRFTKK